MTGFRKRRLLACEASHAKPSRDWSSMGASKRWWSADDVSFASVTFSASNLCRPDVPGAGQMAEGDLETIQLLLTRCTDDERRIVFEDLRRTIRLHRLEIDFSAPAEVILEAIHRAPELTRRMLRGVIADAAFATIVVPSLAKAGWRDVTPEGNHSFDHELADAIGSVTVQVKLQRSERGSPVITTGTRYGLVAGMYMVEPQRTRSGRRRGNGNGLQESEKTRPYRYGEFDILAVSLQPSSGDWSSFRYTVGSWLLAGKRQEEIATYQPVPMTPDDDWTDSFDEVVKWFRSGHSKRIRNK